MSDTAIQTARHHPVLAQTGRHGCWSWCSCGWRSDIYTTVSGAHIAFGEHLVWTADPTSLPVASEQADLPRTATNSQ